MGLISKYHTSEDTSDVKLTKIREGTVEAIEVKRVGPNREMDQLPTKDGKLDDIKWSAKRKEMLRRKRRMILRYLRRAPSTNGTNRAAGGYLGYFRPR